MTSKASSYKKTLLKFFSFFSVIRGYNILIVILAQYLSAIFIFGSQVRAKNVLLDPYLFLIIASSTLAIASGYIINNFYDTEKDKINRPFKSTLDQNISKSTQLKTYFTLNFTSVLLATIISWKAALFYSVYIFLLWYYSHKIKKNYPMIANITASILALLPFFGILMHFVNFSWGIFAHAFYLYLIVLVRELIKDLENIKGDFANNYQTVPVLFGTQTTKITILLLTICTNIPAYALIYYYEIGYMQYYFYISFGLLLAFSIFLKEAHHQNDYKKLHILLKLIITLGVISIILIDPKVILHGKTLVEPYL